MIHIDIDIFWWLKLISLVFASVLAGIGICLYLVFWDGGNEVTTRRCGVDSDTRN